MRALLVSAGVCAVAGFLTIAADSTTDKPIYRDPSVPVERRVDDLLRRMTLKKSSGR